MELQDFIKCLKDKAIDHREYFHYTTVDKYLKMQKPVALPNGETHRMFWLTRATDTNDGMERNYGAHEYLGCFTYSPYENVGMWFMYGKESPGAVRIGFDQKHFKKWRKANIWDDGKSRKAKLYSVSSDSEGMPVYREIPADQIVDVCFYDVAYVCSKEDVEHHRWPKSVEWRREYYEVRSDDPDIVSDKGSLLCSNDFTGRMCSKLPFCFKKKGWANEREVRLVVSLKPESVAGKTIAIPFDEPLECIASDTKRHVVMSPWCSSSDNYHGMSENTGAKSVFMDELKATRLCNKVFLSRKERVKSGTICVNVKTWSEFYQIAGWFAEESHGRWVFRGQRNARWGLRTTLERTLDEKAHLPGSERSSFVIGDFLGYLKCNSKSEKMADAEWAIIQCFKTMICWQHYMGESILPYVMAMQHYGIPTRLLDFTYSLFTALYFASTGNVGDADWSVWAVRLDRIVKWVRDNCNDYTEGETEEHNFLEVAEKVLSYDKKFTPELNGIIPICSANNPRMLAQKGLFLMPINNYCFENALRYALGYNYYGIINPSTDTNGIDVDTFARMNYDEHHSLIKFIFDKDMSKRSSQILASHNIDETMLFPESGEDKNILNRIKAEAERILQHGLF